MSDVEYLGKWLTEERKQQALKFDHAQQVKLLRDAPITSERSFGGMSGSYWVRLQKIRQSPEFQERDKRKELLPAAAQYAAKTVSALTAIATTLRTQNKDKYGGAPDLVVADIIKNTPDNAVKLGARWLDTPDYYETPTGMSLGWYSARVAERGIPKTNLGIASEILRVRPLYLEAATIAVAQFAECLEETGTLPIGGTSSGNISLYRPE